ncbi:hypothetical protein HYH03_010717 [Edaphochlamys debaryana]|uniref:Uncharacterized protein n=1 Tax=Edaphochlamys debaryana TaxID=47281 RepID=A0A836BVV0_9CHLO|nr:hypothetical protein HYH03_010717 [Edaphochlamys debaryana]|eukprot:KAG2490795.1 hypothetical protein HYH03_010717 [Edaphochlamys debaryana]
MNNEALRLLDFCAEALPHLGSLSLCPVGSSNISSDCSVRDALTVVRAAGIPEQVTWCDSYSNDVGYGTVNLRRQRCTAAADGIAGAGSGAGPAPVPAALTAGQVEQRALVRMLAAAGGADGGCVVLTGPLVRRLLPDPEALRVWVERVQSEAATCPYLLLAASGAVVMGSMSGAEGQAVAEAALRLAAAEPLADSAAGAGGTGGGADAEPVLEARLSSLSWDQALGQVLQAWWDGEEQGGAGGAAAPSGSGGGGRAPWPQLERDAWAGPGGAVRDPRLAVEFKQRLPRPPVDAITGHLSSMTSLRCLCFNISGNTRADEWKLSEMRTLLDSCVEALPCLETLSVWPVDVGEAGGAAHKPTNEDWLIVSCTLAGGVLTRVGITTGVCCEQLSRICTEVLLPCKALGRRRLPLLEVDCVTTHREDDEPLAAAELISRCDCVAVTTLDVGPDCTVQSTLSRVRLMGLPEEVTWCDAYTNDVGYGTVRLRGQRCTAAADGSAGAGSGAGPVSASAALTPEQVLQRALARMLAAGWGAGSASVVVTGPLVRGLLTYPAALHAWVQRVRSEAATGADRGPAYIYLPLAGPGAVVMECKSGADVQAVAAAALRHAAVEAQAGSPAAAGGTGGGADAEPAEARLSRLSLEELLAQVLQAWWDGEEQGGAGGAAAPSGSGGGGRAPWPQLERVRLLLEMAEGLSGSMKRLCYA